MSVLLELYLFAYIALLYFLECQIRIEIRLSFNFNEIQKMFIGAEKDGNLIY